MDTTTLGPSRLAVSVVGLGCGGSSRLGQRHGASEAESVELVRAALELGITYLDTAEAYGTETIVGKALVGAPEGIAVSTKARVRGDDGRLVGAGELRSSLEGSLRRLRRECVEVFHLHGVAPEEYGQVAAELVPELERLRDAGLIRLPAISERFGADPSHRMLERALDDGCWEVMMVGFNPLNPSARRSVLPRARERGVGIEVMYAVRRAFSEPGALRGIVAGLREQGLLPGDVDPDDPLGFLIGPGGAASLTEAAYRFSRHEPGVDVVLTGTGSRAHLEENVRALLAAPLPEEATARLELLFGGLDHLSGNEAGAVPAPAGR